MKETFYAFLTVLVFVVLTGFERVDSYESGYIDTYCVLAIQQMNTSGIPASIILGQAIIESNFGTSRLATEANNHFGIKCKSYWTGETFYHKDDDYKNGRLIESCFRSYSSSIKSYRDHSNFLVNTERYRKLFELSSDDYKGWANGLKDAGYATNPRYAEMLINTIEKYKLNRFDTINLDNYRLK